MGIMQDFRKSLRKREDYKAQVVRLQRENERLERKLRNLRDYVDDIFKNGNTA